MGGVREGDRDKRTSRTRGQEETESSRTMRTSWKSRTRSREKMIRPHIPGLRAVNHHVRKVSATFGQSGWSFKDIHLQRKPLMFKNAPR